MIFLQSEKTLESKIMTVKIEYFPVYYTKLPHYADLACNLTYATSGSACFDICAALNTPISIAPGERFKCPTGIKIAPQNPFWCRINGRSGLAANHGIIPIGGIIDTDYRGEIMVILLNTNPAGGETYTINPGDKIAQGEFPFPYKADFKEISLEEFDKLTTSRGSNGFGSSGK